MENKISVRHFQKRAFTLLEIAIVTSILGIIALITIPGLLRARINANHTAVISDLKVFGSSNDMYLPQQSPPVFAPNVGALTAGNIPFLDTTWNTANAAPGKHNYTFTYSADPNGAAYSMVAAPANIMGINTYCVDQTSVIVGGNGGGTPTGNTAGCTGGTPIT